MEEKKCFKCGETKPLSEFYKHPQMSDGHLGKCKQCTRNDTTKYRELYPEAYFESRLKAHEKNPTKTSARRVVEAALKVGKLKKPSQCQGCGRSANETRIGAHHYDYSKPLDVVWLCAACHRPLDYVRQYVESGQSWSDYKKRRTKTYNYVKRALEFYRDNCKHRKEFNVGEILKDARF